MRVKWILKSIRLTALLLIVVMAYSCSSSVSGSPSPRGNLIESKQVFNGACPDKSAFDSMLSSGVTNVWMLADPVLAGLSKQITDLVRYPSYTTKQITYNSVDLQGKTLTLSGLLIVPQTTDNRLQSLPILSIQHPTQLETSSAPSENPTSMPVELAATMACAGYAVLMPDYEGFGVSTTMHPYVVAKPLVNSVVDLIRAVRDYQKDAFNWNKKLYLMGFSEGGYVTMATAREIQDNLSGELPLTAVAPLEGPYDLSDTMRSIMVSNDAVIAPFFLPYAILGYYHAYGDSVFSPDYSMKPPYNTTLPPLFDGKHGMLAVNKALPNVPKKILTDAFLNDLSPAGGKAFNYLASNNAYVWNPRIPLMMFHHKDDTIVPYGNSQSAMDYFTQVGSKTAQLTSLTFTSPYPVHIFGFAPIMIKGFLWLNGQ